MKLYELKSGQKFKLLDLNEVFTFEKVDGMYARIFTPTGELAFITCYVEVLLCEEMINE